jgi:hypothetical protein
LTCCRGGFETLSRAAARAAKARLRAMGIGVTASDWQRRAETCERCPLRVIRNNISYCGRPLLERIERDVETEGCGCPTRAKARSPEEHCPLDRSNRAARRIDGRCTCKWCTLTGEGEVPAEPGRSLTENSARREPRPPTVRRINSPATRPG